MRKFHLLRHQDESGVSGTGIVAEGVVFSDGQAVLCWRSVSGVNSLGIYRSIEELAFIHGHGGKTEVVFVEPTK